MVVRRALRDALVPDPFYESVPGGSQDSHMVPFVCGVDVITVVPSLCYFFFLILFSIRMYVYMYLYYIMIVSHSSILNFIL